jgi:hypothetical protein
LYRIRHPLFAKEIIEQLAYQVDGVTVNFDIKASRLTDILVGFIRESKTYTTVEHDAVMEVLGNLFIFRDRTEDNRDEDYTYKKFSPLIETIRSYCEKDVDKSNRVGRIFKTLVEEYSEDAHFKAHLARFYSRIEKNYDEGVICAEEALELADIYESGSDPFLHHIYGMSLKLRIEEHLTVKALDINSQKDLTKQDSDQIQKYINLIIFDANIAIEEFRQSRTSYKQDAGYYAAIDMCINILDFAKKLSNIEDNIEFITSDLDAWYMKYLDIAEGLMNSWKNSEDDSYISAQTKILNFYDDDKSLDRVIAMLDKSA